MSTCELSTVGPTRTKSVPSRSSWTDGQFFSPLFASFASISRRIVALPLADLCAHYGAYHDRCTDMQDIFLIDE